jgi:hypothetical protein
MQIESKSELIDAMAHLNDTPKETCTRDRKQLIADLNTPRRFVSWLDYSGGFMGKSDKEIAAEEHIAQCSDCSMWFFKTLGGQR